ncbi:hypothetical protein [Burkholderia gladioli]|uniref:hypothetical protein n=1 Tax=Burkholderia gladioli TaxID=28095 RepID=UPI0016410C38|nr:hypothetical protein [Burkholderia gladioli]
MNHQTITTRPALSDHYTVNTGRMVVGKEDWTYSGTLFRNGFPFASFEERGDGGDMACFDAAVALALTFDLV